MGTKDTKTFEFLKKRIQEDGAVLSLLFDPPDQSPERAGQIAKIGAKKGADLCIVGGSVGAQGELLDQTVLEIKEKSELPVILFPGGVGTVSKEADAIYFMSLLNSRNPYWISQAQITVAPHVRHVNIEVIPTTYLVMSPGAAVGWVGDVNLLPRNIPYLTAYSALAGEYLGAQIVLLEGGSGADLAPPFEAIAAAKKLITIPLSVGGGVRTGEDAYQAVKAGADDIRIGTVIENNGSLEKIEKKIEELAVNIKKAGKEKL
ncbi:MAG: geranylgeranylglyceryl/heptaprenylglyceryl phosphate synthase [Candidatus Diapherotrites archaeon]|nr:geranylgeranylglyceryl/heptaprenylglyceryl phosphate synthase [Candidatus Diapherotrites archaeon]